MEAIDREIPVLERPVRIERHGDVHPTAPFEVVITNAPEEDEMNAEQEKKLDKLVDAVTALVERLDGQPTTMVVDKGQTVEMNGKPTKVVDVQYDEDALYARIRARLLKDAPALMKILAVKPEINVAVTRDVIEVDGKTLRGRLARLIADGFFDEARAGNAAFSELQRLGFSTAKPNVYRELDGLAALGFLTKEPTGGYQAVTDMKVNVVRK